VQWAKRTALHNGILRRLGGAECGLRQQDEKGVEVLLSGFGFRQRPLGQLDRRYILVSDAPAQLRGCRIVKLGSIHVHHERPVTIEPRRQIVPLVVDDGEGADRRT